MVVEDENDNAPRFKRLFRASVREDAAVPRTLLRIIASDADDTVESSENINFALENDGEGALAIDNQTGVVMLLKQLDREKVLQRYVVCQ